jgi:hypothetical protein
MDGSPRLPSAGAVTQHSFRTAVQEMNALQNLPVLQVGERLKIKYNRPAAKAMKQTNPLQSRCLSQPEMGKHLDSGIGMVIDNKIARAFDVSRPDVQMNGIAF